MRAIDFTEYTSCNLVVFTISYDLKGCSFVSLPHLFPNQVFLLSFLKTSSKPGIATLTQLLAKGAFTVPDTLRPYLAYLCRIYTDPGPPLHLTDRLLADLKVPTCVKMTKPVEEVGEHPDQAFLKRPGKKAARWIGENAQNVKFLMTRVGRPETWDREVSHDFYLNFQNRWSLADWRNKSIVDLITFFRPF